MEKQDRERLREKAKEGLLALAELTINEIEKLKGEIENEGTIDSEMIRNRKDRAHYLDDRFNHSYDDYVILGGDARDWGQLPTGGAENGSLLQRYTSTLGQLVKAMEKTEH